MHRAVRYVLLFSYYHAQVMGLLGFKYDFCTGRVSTSVANTVYTGAVNVLFVIELALIYRGQLRETALMYANELHRYLFVAMSLLRLAAVMITLKYNWRQRRHVIAVIRDFHRLQRRYFGRFTLCASRQCRFGRNIVLKFVLSHITEWSLLVVMNDVVRAVCTWQLMASMLTISVLGNVLSTFLNHSYFAMLSVNVHLHLLNEELARIVEAARSATRRQHERPGGFSVRCCQLADALDELALMHERVQGLGTRINAMYSMQGGAAMMHIYLNNISWIFQLYMLSHRRLDLGMTVVGMGALATSLVAYYSDIATYILAWTEPYDLIDESHALLRQLSTLQSLDERLEQSIESFALQLAANPFKLPVLRFFNFDRQMFFAILGSVISHSIVLVQMEYKNH